jgi:hypothetical protein
MANNTAWAGGLLNGSSTAFFSAFNAADLASLANLSSILSSVAAFDNTTLGDQFMDISFIGAFASAQTVLAGAGVSFFLATLMHNGTTYGDGRQVAGTQIAYTPLLTSIGGFPVQQGSTTNWAGAVLEVPIPPRKLALICQNITGFAFAPTGCSCSISTYKQNTNA